MFFQVSGPRLAVRDAQFRLRLISPADARYRRISSTCYLVPFQAEAVVDAAV